MVNVIGIVACSLSLMTLRKRQVDAYVPRQYLAQNTYQSLVSKERRIKPSSKASLSARLIEIPLLDFLPSNNNDDDEEEEDKDNPKTKKRKKVEEILVQPLPSVHLQQQPELSNIHVYGMKLTVPLHQQIINHAWDITAMNTATNTADPNKFDLDDDDDDMMPQRCVPYDDPTKIPLVGIVAYKPSTGSDREDSTKHPALGAIGCVVQVLYNAAIMNNDEYKQNLNIDENISHGNKNKKTKKKKAIRYNTPSTSKTVLCRGLFRFIVRDIKQSIPYTVALVEELLDGNEKYVDETSSPVASNVSDSFSNMTTTELMQRTLQSMQSVIDRMIENAIQSSNQPLTPLEEAILQDNGMTNQQQQVMNDIRETAQEYNNMWTMFRSSLVDMTPNERYYAVPIMAAEICHFPNNVRRQMLVTTNPMERLRIACRAATAAVFAAMSSSSSTRTSIQNTVVSSSSPMEGMVGTGSSNSGTVITSQNLNVGTPTLPSWSKKIKKGTILEYYWNEEYGWCRGQVIEDPLRIVPDEIVLTMHFPDDDSTHRLPFSADEKVRWRPPSSSSTQQ